MNVKQRKWVSLGVFLIMLIAGLVIIGPFSDRTVRGDTWYDSSWSHSRKITIDNTKVDSTLAFFPILIDDVSADYIQAQSNGNDFVFMNSDNTTQYNHEIEYFDRQNGELICWVNVTSVSSSVDTIVWMYWGNPEASNQEHVEDTWDSNYLGVYHLDESSGTTCYDSNDGYEWSTW